MIMEYEGKEYELVEVVGWGCAGCEFIKNKGCIEQDDECLLEGNENKVWKEVK